VHQNVLQFADDPGDKQWRKTVKHQAALEVSGPSTNGRAFVSLQIDNGQIRLWIRAKPKQFQPCGEYANPYKRGREHFSSRPFPS
jgi:hypothetical protein